ncbi:MAG: NADH-quinone oxidoreductase subunit NuoE [Spirochaetes bacterium]|nr:NADH-quinone oxidoreductase subunit NuoE [Spirochaetota bacterium]
MNQNIEKQNEAMLNDITSIIAGFGCDRGNLIPILQMIQGKYSFLSPEAIKIVADHLNITSCDVYGVATFYNQFRFSPPGRHHIKVCLGTACHVRGGDIILENFERKLEIKHGETTPDREYSLEKVACVGCCALAPVAVVDNVTQAHVAPSRIEGIFLGFDIEKQKKEKDGSAN